MKLRSKLTLSLLFISLISAAMVGGIAYRLLMRDFRQSIMDNAFQNFQADVTAYIELYGSWDEAQHNEPFHLFAERQRFGRDPATLPPPGERLHEHDGRPPFRFLLLDPDGRVIKEGRYYVLDQQIPSSLLRKARPIKLHGKVVALAVPVGDPNLSHQDLSYLSAMRHALLIGFLAAGSIALLLGLVFGRRMSSALDQLTRAIRTLQPGSEIKQVRISSRDEIGELASAFNRMSAELDKAHHELREQSIRDPLTQLHNRRYFSEQSHRLYEQAQRYDHPLTVMVGDLDHFKEINDRFSHAVGDEVLRRIATLLSENTRKSDLLSRYGGEEFVIAFAETSLEQAFAYCEQLRQRIEEYPWQEIHPELRVTMSMGLNAEKVLGSVEKMLMAADSQLYAAKEAGRNRVSSGLTSTSKQTD